MSHHRREELLDALPIAPLRETCQRRGKTFEIFGPEPRGRK
jgi:hypothetical protein